MKRCAGFVGRSCVLLLALAAGMAGLRRAQAAGAGSNGPSDDSGNNASVQEYRKHLEALDALVARCRKQRTREACDASQVGLDDRVLWSAGGTTSGTGAERTIRYDWLRDLLERAGEKDASAPAPAMGLPLHGIKTTPVTMDELLGQAEQRLEGDWRQAGAPGAQAEDYDAERRSLDAILAQREYQGTTEVSAKERFEEWLENKIAEFFEKLMGFGARAPWIGYVLEALLVIALGTTLIWALIRLERRFRVRLTPDVEPVSSAPSAREWQLWLKDARAMAAEGRWREAIHFLYWASISRLESMRLWPADSARTPREYLRLLKESDARRAKLTALTRSFERTWYGGREAHSSDFEAALKTAAELGVE
jgi:Domain of unknown function (DUF4129)